MSQRVSNLAYVNLGIQYLNSCCLVGDLSLDVAGGQRENFDYNTDGETAFREILFMNFAGKKELLLYEFGSA